MRLRLTALLLCLSLSGALLYRAETSTLAKSLLLLCLVGAWLSSLALLWQRRKLRLPILVLPLLFAVPFALPSREPDTESLRARYLTELSGFDGTHYVWGGENARGIDCSGLVRTGLINATFHEGLTRFDGALLRRAVMLWWFDASAKALGEGYREWTREVTLSSELALLDASVLRPGDLAVTQDGLHVLAYLGDGRWIQADPLVMQVHSDAGGWFHAPVRVMRWRWLE